MLWPGQMGASLLSYLDAWTLFFNSSSICLILKAGMKLFVDCWSVSVRGNVGERKTGVKNTFPTEAVRCNMAAAPTR